MSQTDLYTAAEALAKKLLGISAEYKVIFDGNGSHRDKEEAWLTYLESSIADNGLGWSKENPDTSKQQELFEALRLIDEQNAERKEADKTRLHEDLIRGILWNKGNTTENSFRRDFWNYDCTVQPVTGYGAFRLFWSKEKHKSFLSNLFNYIGSFVNPTPALSRLKDYDVLLITRRDKMKGVLGGLVDLLDPQQPLNKQIEGYVFQRVGMTLLQAFGIDPSTVPEITSASHVLGHRPEEAAKAIENTLYAKIQDRVAIEAIDAVSVPLKILLQELLQEFVKMHFLTAQGRADSVTLDAKGALALLNLSEPGAAEQLHARASRGEAIEELSNILSVLKAGQFLEETPEMKEIREQLLGQFETLVTRLKTFEQKRTEQQIRGFADPERDLDNPLPSRLTKLPIDSVRDWGFALEEWNPPSFKEAVRPSKFPRVRLTKPMGALQEIAAPMLNMLHDAGQEAKRIFERIHNTDVKDPRIQELLAGVELRGMAKIPLAEAISMCGDTSGLIYEGGSGFGENNFRYQHEWSAPLYLAVQEFKDNPLPFKTPEKSVIQAIVEIQREIIKTARAAGQMPYVLQINTALRMMAGGRLDNVSDAKVIARDFGLKPNTFILAQQAVIDEMQKAGYKITGFHATYDKKKKVLSPLEESYKEVTDGGFAFGPNPRYLAVSPA